MNDNTDFDCRRAWNCASMANVVCPVCPVTLEPYSSNPLDVENAPVKHTARVEQEENQCDHVMSAAGGEQVRLLRTSILMLHVGEPPRQWQLRHL